MPTYEYRCPANGRLVEMRHGMAERLASRIVTSSTGTCKASGCAGGGCGAGLCCAADF